MFKLSPKFPHTPVRQRPQTVAEQQLADRARFDPDWSHAFIQRPKLPISTVGNYAYATLGLVEYSPIGWGELPKEFPAMFRTVASNGRPLIYHRVVGPVQGLGGLVQGQMFMQPLYDPNEQGYVG